MLILLDECMPKRFKKDLQGFTVRSVAQMGWASKKNGVLLNLMKRAGFDVFITIDSNLTYQQNLKDADLAVVVLSAKTNRHDDLKVIIPTLRALLETIEAGKIYHLKA